MTEQSYTTTISVDRTPKDVFEAINDVGAWWNQVEGRTDEVGAEFSYEVPDIHYVTFRVTELVPGERVVWRVVDSRLTFVADQREWDGTEVRFDIAAREGASEVRFTHAGLHPRQECYDICATAWTHYVANSLRRLLATGTGLPGTNPDGEDGAHDAWLERQGTA